MTIFRKIRLVLLNWHWPRSSDEWLVFIQKNIWPITICALLLFNLAFFTNVNKPWHELRAKADQHESLVKKVTAEPTYIWPTAADINKYLASRQVQAAPVAKSGAEGTVADDGGPEELGVLDAEDELNNEIVSDSPAVAVQTGNELINVSIGRGGTMAKALGKLGLSNSEITTAIAALSPLFDMRRLRPEDRLVAVKSTYISQIQVFRSIKERYQLDRAGPEQPWTGSKVDINTTTEQRVIHGTITSSLYQALADAGENSNLAPVFADIFSWEIDFFTEVRSGDEFGIVLERELIDGQVVPGTSKILAAAYSGAVGNFQAFRNTKDAAYYDENGNSVQKAFLRAPLQYARVTSNYGVRHHPILNYSRKHNGIDYGVPVGSPVWSVADGTVTKVAIESGAGKYIKVRYANGYEALYAHLSAFKVRVGQKVKQKQVIALTGNTGLSTGPHLHYGLKKNGKYINPATEKFPRGTPLVKSDSELFAGLVKQYQPLLSRTSSNVSMTEAATTAVAELAE